MMGTARDAFAHPTDALRAYLRGMLPDWMVAVQFCIRGGAAPDAER